MISFLTATLITSIVAGSDASVVSSVLEGAEQEEVTIAQTLNAESWLSSDVQVDDGLFGNWGIDSNSELEIYPFPVAGNSCLVKLENRMVPAFTFEANGMRFLVVGTHAGESLQLQPKVYRYHLDGTQKALQLELVALAGDRDEFLGLADISEVLSQENSNSIQYVEKLEFRRI